MSKNTSILIVVFLVGLIWFDAAQQKYYLDEFDLPGSQISFLALLQNHLIRWGIWGLISIPMVFFVKNRFFKSEPPNTKEWTIIGGLICITILLSLISISFYGIFSQQLSMEEFGGFFHFFIFQKGLTFLMASLMLILLIFNQSRLKMIGEQCIEIKNLKKATSHLKEALQQEEIPHLNVKTGYKLKPVPLVDIIWIQSDDYCVKIHTEEQSFTLRQSLKTLEDKLTPYRFIRIHRTALLNLEYLEQINFDTAKVKLVNQTEIPYSKTGIKHLKERIKDVAG
jgi:uncharacterized membrane protein